MLDTIFLALKYSEETENNASPDASVRAKPSNAQVASSGSGFWVSGEGHVLTNAHVVSDCGKISVNSKPAIVIDASETFDLALLLVSEFVGNEFATFSGSPAQLNSNITVLGFPLSGLLGGLNVTRGSVSSLKGLQGNSMHMQISAPVQPGNSGGPVFSSSGQIVGVVVSKLNAQYVADAIGDIPQNVNFAIRGEIAKLFLFQNGVEPIVSASTKVLEPVTLAEEASKITTFIECN